MLARVQAVAQVAVFFQKNIFCDSKKIFCDFSVKMEVENEKTESINDNEMTLHHKKLFTYMDN